VRQGGNPLPAPNAMAPLITGQGRVVQAASASDVLALERMIGNQAVSRMLSGVAPRPGVRAGRLSRAMLQRELVLGGTRRATAEDVKPDLGADFDDAMRDTVKALIDLPVVVTLPDAVALREVHAFWTKRTEQYPPRPRSVEAALAILQLLSHGAWAHTRTERRLALPIWAAFNTPPVWRNLAGLGDFLRTNPNVVANLKAAGVGWEFMSKHQFIEGFGGAAVIKERIHIHSDILGMGDPEGFKKMAIHEAGHATFQRILITGEGWTDAANRGDEPPAERSLEPDGRTFYEAWRVLRRQPRFFFVTDMPGGRPEATGMGRKNYLAEQFQEFCADSFMHMALRKDQLEAHVKRLPFTAGADVKSAWRSALSILLKYEPQILGQQAGAGVETIGNHRFITVLQKLKTALGSSTLEAADPEKARRLLNRLREAWNGLTPGWREHHRREALRTLDQYMYKVQRRRPAQVYLGSELEFAGL
jgi:hypothetical protein